MKPWLTAMFIALAALPLGAGQVTVFAAASLTDALKEVASAYKMQAGEEIVFNFAGSGTLARQIEAGAPADIFLSADEAKADGLEKKGLLARASRKSLLGNTLVMVTRLDNSTLRAPAELTNAAVARVAVGDVKAVPAGTYAREYLDQAGLWSLVEPKVVQFENVRAVLAAVESGNVEAGIVYKTDAAISRKVKIVFEVPRKDGPKISYPVALLKDAPEPEAARQFMAYLESDAAAAVFEKFGFIVLKPE